MAGSKDARTVISCLVVASLLIEVLKRGYNDMDHTHEGSPLHLPFHHTWQHEDPHALDDHVLPGVGSSMTTTSTTTPSRSPTLGSRPAAR